MSEALFNLGLILCAVSGVFCIGCIFSSVFDSLTRHNRMATSNRRGRHYQGGK